MNEYPNLLTIIPANIRYDKSVPVGEKFLYSDISGLINQDGFCVAGDKYFMNTCQSSQATIQRWITSLEKNGYIDRTVKYKDRTKEIEERRIRIISNNPTLNIMNKP